MSFSLSIPALGSALSVKSISPFLLFILLAATAQADPGNAYISIEKHLQQHPEQATLMHAFAAQVDADPRPLNPEQLKPIKIAAVYPGVQQSDYWRRNMRALRLRLDRLGFTYQFFDRPHAASASIEHQQLAISEALAEDPDYLILTLDDPRKKRLIEQLLSRDRPKIILLNITTPLAEWESHQPFFYSGFDHVKGTTLLAEALFKLTPKESRSIGLLYRNPGYVSKMRGGTFLDLLQAQGETLSASYYTQADVTTSRSAALQLIIDDPKLNVIFTCATDVALGAIQAINEQGHKGQIIVNGWGGGEAELEAIKNGDMALTVMRMNDDTAIAIAEAIGNDQSGRPVPQIYSGRFVIVTGQQSPEEIQGFTATAFRYSNL